MFRCCFSDKSAIDFGQCVLGQPVSVTVQLVNQTVLPSVIDSYVVNFPSGTASHPGEPSLLNSQVQVAVVSSSYSVLRRGIACL